MTDHPCPAPTDITGDFGNYIDATNTPEACDEGNIFRRECQAAHGPLGLHGKLVGMELAEAPQSALRMLSELLKCTPQI